MYEVAKKEYHPEDVSPFIQAHHVVAAVQSAKTGKIYTGFCIEGASGVMNLCAERVAVLKMYMEETGKTPKDLVLRVAATVLDDLDSNTFFNKKAKQWTP